MVETEHLGVLGQKIDLLESKVDMIGGKLDGIAHILFEGNGDSLVTRLKLVESRCGEHCPMVQRLKMVETEASDTRRFRRNVAVGLTIAAAGGAGQLVWLAVTALIRVG